MGNFNIRDCLWNPCFLYCSFYSDILFDIADSFQLEISKPTENFLTRYSDNNQDSNSILDLVFLWPNWIELNNYYIYLDWRLFSDHASISVDISIVKEQIQSSKHVLIKNSKEKDWFIKELINSIKNLKTDSILNSSALEEIVNSFATNINSLWYKHSKKVNITRHSKAWWNNNC